MPALRVPSRRGKALRPVEHPSLRDEPTLPEDSKKPVTFDQTCDSLWDVLREDIKWPPERARDLDGTYSVTIISPTGERTQPTAVQWAESFRHFQRKPSKRDAEEKEVTGQAKVPLTVMEGKVDTHDGFVRTPIEVVKANDSSLGARAKKYADSDEPMVVTFNGFELDTSSPSMPLRLIWRSTETAPIHLQSHVLEWTPVTTLGMPGGGVLRDGLPTSWSRVRAASVAMHAVQELSLLSARSTSKRGGKQRKSVVDAMQLEKR